MRIIIFSIFLYSISSCEDCARCRATQINGVIIEEEKCDPEHDEIDKWKTNFKTTHQHDPDVIDVHCEDI